MIKAATWCSPFQMAEENRRFGADGPNMAWFADIAYVKTRQGWLYLTLVIHDQLEDIAEKIARYEQPLLDSALSPC